MLLVIDSVDYAPGELDEQVPIHVDLLRELPGNDRPDYWLGRVRRPIRWIADNRERAINHVVLAARWQGTSIEPGVHNLPVGIAYVTDETLLQDARLDFGKCTYVAIGTADYVQDDACQRRPGHRGILAGVIGRLFGVGGGKQPPSE